MPDSSKKKKDIEKSTSKLCCKLPPTHMAMAKV